MSAPAVNTLTSTTTPPASSHAVPGLSFDEARLEERRNTLGASEIAAVAGVNPFKNALDIYLEKKGIAPPFVGNAFTEWGLRLEGAIAQKYAELHGVTLGTSDTLRGPATYDWMSCTPDRIVPVIDGRPDQFYGLEIKRYGEYRADDFGVPGTGEVPLDLAAQCLWSMIVTGFDRWDVAVLIGQADFRTYSLPFDETAADALIETGKNFWFNHVLANVEPAIDGSKSAHKYLQQKYATHSAILLDPTPALIEIGRELAETKAQIKLLESTKDVLENQIKNVIGDAAGIRNVATWKLDRVGRPVWKAIAEKLGANDPKNAPLVQQHTSPPSRRFRLLIEEES